MINKKALKNAIDITTSVTNNKGFIATVLSHYRPLDYRIGITVIHSYENKSATSCIAMRHLKQS